MYRKRSKEELIEMLQNRRGVMYNLNENGVARLIFEKDRSSFQGILETPCGEVISLRGQANPNEEGFDNVKHLMEIFVVDGEAGTSFQLDNVPVFADGQNVQIQHSTINFASRERLVGVRALQEIQQFFNPSMLGDCENEVFVGLMQVQVIASKRTRAPSRRESLCCENSVTILELSDDFLA
ncbi:unnamed protein product, partial [Mesorhabditis belari]|uniref:Uncharacterized protein n=1 Tax=Mesorhabditis belari TaxID=2138241 RepID=A0AAF3FP23_9BILA